MKLGDTFKGKIPKSPDMKPKHIPPLVKKKRRAVGLALKMNKEKIGIK